MRNRTTVAAVLCIMSLHAALLARGNLSGEERLAQTREAVNDMTQIIEHIVKPKSPVDLVRDYQQLMDKAGDEEVSALKCHDNDGLALRAAWEEIKRTIPNELQDRPIRPDNRALHRFLGFIEGRLRCTVPAEWKEALLDVQAYKRASFFFSVPNKWKYVGIGQGYRGSSSVTMKRSGGEVILLVGKKAVAISRAVKDDDVMNNCVAASVNTDECYVVLHCFRPLPYQLYRIERRTSALKWKTDVWASGCLVFQGLGEHAVALKEVKDHVLVFGVADECVYLEGFSTETGRNLFRFSTSY